MFHEIVEWSCWPAWNGIWPRESEISRATGSEGMRWSLKYESHLISCLLSIPVVSCVFFSASYSNIRGLYFLIKIPLYHITYMYEIPDVNLIPIFYMFLYLLGDYVEIPLLKVLHYDQRSTHKNTLRWCLYQ